MTLEQMCGSCIHKHYCLGAFKKDHWCGNHTERRERSVVIDKMCYSCDFHDSDLECTCPEHERWYACKLANPAPEDFRKEKQDGYKQDS